MPIISSIERRTGPGRLAVGTIYALLIIGAISMVYPFLLMLRLATADAVDQHSLSPLPAFWWDEDVLVRKYLEDQYSEKGQQLSYAYGSTEWTSFAQAKGFWEKSFKPLESVPFSAIEQRTTDYREYLAKADLRFLYPQFTYIPGRGLSDRWISFWLAEKEGVSPDTYRYFERPRPDWKRRDWTPTYDKPWNDWQEWVAWLEPAERYAFSSSYPWQRFLGLKYDSIEALNTAHGANYPSFALGPVLPVEAPAVGSPLRADWVEFIETSYPLYWQQLTPAAVAENEAPWRDWLRSEKKIRNPADWKAFTGLDVESLDQIDLSPEMPQNEILARWWTQYVADEIGWEGRLILSSEENFHTLLKEKYGDIGALNTAWDTSFDNWAEIRFPLTSADYHTLQTHGWRIKSYLTFKNFEIVLRSLVFEGGAFVNTFIVISLSILTSLTVNPLAAYALSRFRLRNSNKILIFLLATMALPAEVAIVPSFLLVRDLGLTDNYLALVLPSAANAFSIFLLKGFFDSLPSELYEAALLDGAGEFTLFFRITIPLSMPIIAVTLLSTTVASYNLFMPAVMYIGDVTMWPISTKIYEINQTSPMGVGMAALVVASIFPLLVFTFCQRIIMRGIILPTMK
jgi:multiple sugar transport system permease protein